MVERINMRQLSTMMKKDEKVILVDVMAEEIHQNVHIKKAINIPFSRIEHDAYDKLDPRATIVTYSLDYECPVSRLAASKLKQFGFRRVFYYPGGLKEWIETNMPVFRSAATAGS